MAAAREFGATIAGAADQLSFPWPDTAEGIKTLSEIELHRAVAQFLDWCLVPPAMFTTFPAGWDRMSKSRAGMLRGCGLVKGFPDILIFSLGQTIGIELKFAKGRLSADQKRTHERLKAAGVSVHVCRDIADVEVALRMEGIPLTGTVRAA